MCFLFNMKLILFLITKVTQEKHKMETSNESYKTLLIPWLDYFRSFLYTYAQTHKYMYTYVHIKRISKGTWLAQLEKHAILDIRS